MQYFLIGFAISIGWHLGKSIYTGLNEALDKIFYERYQWYRETKDKFK